MGNSRSAAFVVLSLAAGFNPAVAQEAPHTATPTFRMGARMMLVPVVVRDREGRALADLTKESFQISDKGKPQEIASFSVERGEAAGAPSATPPSQFIVYFMDDVSLHDFSTVMAVREAALHQAASLRPGDRVAVFSSSCRLAQDFTDESRSLRVSVCSFRR